MDSVTKHHYSIEETCFILGISRSQLYKLVSVGDIRPVKIGTRTLFPGWEIERFTDGLFEHPIDEKYGPTNDNLNPLKHTV
jgi:excisionase family DNA binding protein